MPPDTADDAALGEGPSGPPPIGFRVMLVPVQRTVALRRAVLGAPGGPELGELAGDDEPTTVAFAAIDTDGEVLSTVRVSVEDPPFQSEGTATPERPARRLRGMATREDARNRGIGSAVLDAAISYVASQGGGLIWCNARTPAVGLYRRANFATRGEVWVDPTYGPHIVMWRDVAT